MTPREQDDLLTQLAVKIIIHTDKYTRTWGSGIIFYAEALGNTVYILTAAHCLYGTDFQRKTLDNIKIEVQLKQQNSDAYLSVFCTPDQIIANHEKGKKDCAVLILSKQTVESITGKLPNIKAINDESRTANTLAFKGFPRAAQDGNKLDKISCTWSEQTEGLFNANDIGDYATADDDNYQVDGFSGSGVFVVQDTALYLYGIITTFRDSGKKFGAVYLEEGNALLRGQGKREIEMEVLAGKTTKVGLIHLLNNDEVAALFELLKTIEEDVYTYTRFRKEYQAGLKGIDLIDWKDRLTVYINGLNTIS